MSEEVTPLGRVLAYVAPDTVAAVKFNVAPARTGPLLPGGWSVGTDGLDRCRKVGLQIGVADRDLAVLGRGDVKRELPLLSIRACVQHTVA